jgi:hypothetical protein
MAQCFRECGSFVRPDLRAFVEPGGTGVSFITDMWTGRGYSASDASMNANVVALEGGFWHGKVACPVLTKASQNPGAELAKMG